MDVIETLAVALGFATLAGLNLYMTVFITGLAIKYDMISVIAKYPELQVLGEPAIIIASGIFFAFEFFSDKIPWVDSLWDSVHTLIRPIGGGLLALHTLGPTEPAFEVIIALLAGGTSLVSHSFKAGTRLAINTSPEPFSNIAASVGGDVAVLGGIALMWSNPILFGVICLAFLCVSLYLAPKMFRRSKAFLWLVWNKIASGFTRKDHLRLYSQLTSDQDLTLSDGIGGEKPDVRWAANVLVGKTKGFRGIASQGFGSIISLENGDDNTLHFIGRRLFRDYHVPISLENMEIIQEPRFLSEDLVIFNRSTKEKLVFRLHAGHRVLAERVVEGVLGVQGGEISPEMAEISDSEKKVKKTAETSNKNSEATVLESE